MQVPKADLTRAEWFGLLLVMSGSPLLIYASIVILSTMLETEKWLVGVGAFFTLLFAIPLAVGCSIIAALVLFYAIGRILTKLNNLS